MNYELKLNYQSWKKESGILFDYNSSDIHTGNLSLRGGCVLVTKDNRILKADEYIDEDYITTLLSNDDGYRLRFDAEKNPKNSSPIQKENWLVLRHTLIQGYKLRERDIIKLGKINFLVKEINNQDVKDDNKEEKVFDGMSSRYQMSESDYFENINNTNPNTSNIMNYSHATRNNNNLFDVLRMNDSLAEVMNLNLNHSMIEKPLVSGEKRRIKEKNIALQNISEKSDQNICRICFCDSKDDLLISACKCTGSVKYIHLTCLKNWLISKISIKVINHLIAYTYENPECEICKTEISESLLVNGEVFNLIDSKSVLEKVQLQTSIINIFGNNLLSSKYIALELFLDKKEKKFVYIICLGEREYLSVGRSIDADVRLTDYSISRYHCCLFMKDKEFHIRDCTSKFGTHLYLPPGTELPIIYNKNLSIQCGKYHISFKMGQTCLSKLFCKKFNSSSKNNTDYNTLLDFQRDDNKKDIKKANVEEIKEISVKNIFEIPFKPIYSSKTLAVQNKQSLKINIRPNTKDSNRLKKNSGGLM